MKTLDTEAKGALEALAQIIEIHPSATAIRLALTNAYNLGCLDGGIAVGRIEQEANKQLLAMVTL